jgi:poly(hydroxyalkanoate) depolymerase family esterase
MVKRRRATAWSKTLQRSFASLVSQSVKAGTRVVGKAVDRAVRQATQRAADSRKPPPGAGDWIAGVAMGAAGARRFRLYRPPGVQAGERLPLMVMLHGCGQDARSFAVSTRMNRVAARGRFLVLYPEQDRLANAQGCWNWFDTRAGRAQGEAALILNAIDQACLLYGADPQRVALAGLSAGASMAALLAVRHPERFKAVVMHSGIPPGTAHSTLSALGAMRGHRAAASPLLQAAVQASPVPAVAWPPLLVIHGGADAVVSVHNGRAAAQLWADAAHAQATPPRTLQRGQRHPMTVTDFKQGRRITASLVEVPNLGHAWSGGGARQPFSDAKGPDASGLAWAFVTKQFKT